MYVSRADISPSKLEESFALHEKPGSAKRTAVHSNPVSPFKRSKQEKESGKLGSPSDASLFGNAGSLIFCALAQMGYRQCHLATLKEGTLMMMKHLACGTSVSDRRSILVLH